MHLDLIDREGEKRIPIASAKTFKGMEFAYDVCKATALLLEA